MVNCHWEEKERDIIKQTQKEGLKSKEQKNLMI